MTLTFNQELLEHRCRELREMSDQEIVSLALENYAHEDYGWLIDAEAETLEEWQIRDLIYFMEMTYEHQAEGMEEEEAFFILAEVTSSSSQSVSIQIRREHEMRYEELNALAQEIQANEGLTGLEALKEAISLLPMCLRIAEDWDVQSDEEWWEAHCWVSVPGWMYGREGGG